MTGPLETLATPSRRALIAGAGASLVAIRTVAAQTPDVVAAAIREAFGDVAVTPGRVALELPSLAENGHSVPLVVTVESPMTAADHVTRIFVFSEKNPSTNVVRFHLSKRSGRARVQTNIRLADTQKITVVAQMADGSCWSGTASTIVTVAACLEDT